MNVSNTTGIKWTPLEISVIAITNVQSMLALFGNSLVIMSIVKNSNMQTASNILIAGELLLLL